VRDSTLARLIVIGIVAAIVLALYLTPTYEKNQRIQVNPATGLCPVMEGCELRPSGVPGYCYFLGDCR
jgi:hypothetical protein